MPTNEILTNYKKTQKQVVSSKSPGSIFWFENNGFQNFNQKIAVSDVYGASGVATADMNSDGRVDVLGPRKSPFLEAAKLRLCLTGYFFYANFLPIYHLSPHV